MRYLDAGHWRLPYMIHDLESPYPHAIGHDDQLVEPVPIEECGNLLVLALAYAQATGDPDWTTQYAETQYAETEGADENQKHFVLECPELPDSWKTPYNIFPDLLLGLGTFPPRAAHQMSHALFSSVRGEFSLPLAN
ncbi:uncharacterized protein N7459_008897 [Penicillium hispanicum]|uniref:uncharacterized protein n=1 Tax=Penicillium hispanicum TaxID=1080232 RepID=UPI0025419524|nr:uncharacterized protein N7459_008897 [Penicillium hispanicum]KAJ5569467.1 hypothetical protein N7459_008897 [Penicillium hispanicum]